MKSKIKGGIIKKDKNISFEYNANGIRTSKIVNGIEHKFTVDGAKILQIYCDQNYILEPIYDNEDSVCGLYYNSEPFYFQKNLQGDIIAISDYWGDIVARYTYDAWGKVTAITGSRMDIANANPFRYRGYFYDVETDLYYLQSRYYDANTGRFINADDSKIVTDSNNILGYALFSYCENNCINYFDITGERRLRLRHISKIKQGTILTIPQFYIEAVADSINLCNVKYVHYNITKITEGKSGSLKNAWNNLGNNEVVIINCHGKPQNINGMSVDGVKNLQYKNIKLLILLGCNNGHYKYMWSNIGCAFSSKISGTVVCSDGSVEHKSTTASSYVSTASESWKKLTGDNKRKNNYGWGYYYRDKNYVHLSYSLGKKINLGNVIRSFV